MNNLLQCTADENGVYTCNLPTVKCTPSTTDDSGNQLYDCTLQSQSGADLIPGCPGAIKFSKVRFQNNAPTAQPVFDEAEFDMHGLVTCKPGQMQQSGHKRITHK